MRVRGYHGEMPFAALPAAARHEWLTIGAAGHLVVAGVSVNASEAGLMEKPFAIDADQICFA